MQLYDAIDETPGIAINIIRLLSRRIRELNQKLNPPTPPVDGNKVIELRSSAG
jgi:hypothetical protein